MIRTILYWSNQENRWAYCCRKQATCTATFVFYCLLAGKKRSV